MPCLILPAHNEEALIGAHLRTLLEGLDPEVHVIVACNGCSDDTAEIARGFSPRVQVLELEKASKVGALNAADRIAENMPHAFPRVYLDADVEISGEHMHRVLGALEAGAVAAEPIPHLDSEGATLWVRAYYRVWQALHGAQPGSVGSGLYGLSQTGRERFGGFPNLIADDGFVRAHFSPGEIQWVSGASSRVRTPRRVGDLIRIKTRSRLGNLELQKAYPELWAKKRKAGQGIGKKAGNLPLALWPSLLVFVPLQAWVRLRAGRKARNMAQYRWERDLSSRE